ncbi:MAG: BatA domain-containing protein [Verrucomicrobiota bacterium]
MLFLNPLLLWFLAAAAIPVAIHLINRRRHKTIQWAAMQFLLKASRQSRGKKKLRHICILVCRTLAIATLAIAAARPVVSGLIGWGGGSIDTVVLLLDRSVSMEQRPSDGLPPRRAIALAQARDAIRDVGSPRLVLLDSATLRPQEIPSPSGLPELSSVSATDSAADIPGLLSAAAEFLAEKTGRTEIWIASDLQASNWRPDDPRWAAARTAVNALPSPPAIRILSVTGAGAADHSLRLLSSRREGADLLLDLEIIRSGQNSAASASLTTHLGGANTTESIVLHGPSLRFQKRLPLPSGTATHGWLSLPADGNPANNTAFFASGPPREVSALVVAPPGESASFLALAASAAGSNVATISPADFANHEVSHLAVILWAALLPEGKSAAQLEAFLTNGGHVAMFPPGTDAEATFSGIAWSPPADAARDKFFVLKDWNQTDGPLRDSFDGTPIAARRLRAIRRQLFTGEATALARWEDGEPALARIIHGRGTIWQFTTLPDYSWSNLADGDVLLPAVQRIVAAGASRFDPSHAAYVGDGTVPATARRLDAAATSPASRAGIYEHAGRIVAVNRPPAEDVPDSMPRETVESLFAGTRHTFLDQSGSSPEPTVSRDVWRTFIIAALLFLLAEALLCLPPRVSHKSAPVSIA